MLGGITGCAAIGGLFGGIGGFYAGLQFGTGLFAPKIELGDSLYNPINDLGSYGQPSDL